MIQATLDSFIDDIVAALEASARKGKPAQLEVLLPSPDHPWYKEAAVELIRVDLELAYSRGEAPQLANYLQRFPGVFADDEAREALAFEDYRQRVQSGDQVTPAEYESAFHVPTLHWSSWRGYDDADAPSTMANRFADDPTRPMVASIESEPTDSEPVPGGSWGGFQIVEALGRGTFGQTYLARQPALANRLVVLKFSQTTTEEADRLARLQHTNIVPVFSIHRHGSRTVLCMPFLGRTTLADVVRRLRDGHAGQADAALPGLEACTGSPEHVHAVLSLVAALADGLSHSHRHGVLHRDIKPANIVLTDDGEPLLIDFNLAVVNDSARAVSAAGGTIPYMSPEQIASFTRSSNVDFRSDIYSLGVVFYELLARRLPWSPPASTQAEEALQQQGEARKVPPTYHVASHCTPAVWQMVDRCLALDPRCRYQSAGQLREDILRHQESLPLRHAANTSAVERVNKWIRRHPRVCSWSTAAAALIAGLVIFLAAWTIREHQFAVVKAIERLHAFVQDMDRLRPGLVSVGLSSVDPFAIIRETEQTATKYLPSARLAAAADESWSHLPVSETAELSDHALELASLLANAKGIMALQAADRRDRNRWLAEATRWNEFAAAQSADPPYVVELQRRRLDQLQSRQGPQLAHQPASDDQRPDAPAELTSAADFLLLGLELDSRRQWAEARNAFRNAVELSPNNSAAWLMLARVHSELEDYPTAIAQLDLCESLLPGSIVPVFERGVIKMQARQFASAAADFAACLEQDVDLQEARYNRALCLMELQDYRGAEEALTQSIDADCRTTSAYFMRAKVRRMLGNAMDAESDLHKGLQAEPTDAESWLERGLARIAIEPEQSLSDFEAALAMNSNVPRSRRDLTTLQALQNMAHLYSERLHRPDDALNTLNQALQLRPHDTMALAGRGVLLARAGKLTEAVRDAETLLSLEIDPVTQYQVACIYSLCSSSDPDLKRPALNALAASLRRDAGILDILPDDPDIQAIRSMAEYQALVAAARTIHGK